LSILTTNPTNSTNPLVQIYILLDFTFLGRLHPQSEGLALGVSVADKEGYDVALFDPDAEFASLSLSTHGDAEFELE